MNTKKRLLISISIIVVVVAFLAILFISFFSPLFDSDVSAAELNVSEIGAINSSSDLFENLGELFPLFPSNYFEPIDLTDDLNVFKDGEYAEDSDEYFNCINLNSYITSSDSCTVTLKPGYNYLYLTGSSYSFIHDKHFSFYESSDYVTYGVYSFYSDSKPRDYLGVFAYELGKFIQGCDFRLPSTNYIGSYSFKCTDSVRFIPFVLAYNSSNSNVTANYYLYSNSSNASIFDNWFYYYCLTKSIDVGGLGVSDMLDDSYLSGYQDGFESAYDDIYQDGYDSGYNDGYNQSIDSFLPSSFTNPIGYMPPVYPSDITSYQSTSNMHIIKQNTHGTFILKDPGVHFFETFEESPFTEFGLYGLDLLNPYIVSCGYLFYRGDLIYGADTIYFPIDTSFIASVDFGFYFEVPFQLRSYFFKSVYDGVMKCDFIVIISDSITDSVDIHFHPPIQLFVTPDMYLNYYLGSFYGGGGVDEYERGYNKGYTEGMNKGLSDNMLSNPLSFFLDPVSEFMNLKLFGVISLGMVFNIVLFVMIAAIFIKMFAGG